MQQEEINIIFNKIANNYDKINDFISLGLHKKIKKDSVKLLEIFPNSKILDLCTGSGDFVKIISEMYPSSKITGIDNCENMLEIAKIKNKTNKFIKADCKNLPINNSSIDFVIISFGLRNILDRTQALSEINRVLKDNGKFLHLDFGNHNFLNKLFDFVLPIFIKLIKSDVESYQYLVKSKENFPEPNKLIKEFEKAGFTLVKRKDYLFHSISAQIMQKL